MKLTWENNQGNKITVEFNKDCITDLETELNCDLALEALFENLKTAIRQELTSIEI